MLSPDLFWGSRPMSGATSEPESKDAAPRRTIQISSKVLPPPLLHRLSPLITYSWGNYTPIVLRLHFRRHSSLLSLKQGFSRSLELGSAFIGLQEANRPRTTYRRRRRRRRRLNSWVWGSVLGTRDDARRQ